ncbi:MAG: hypothetical protein AABW54_04080 [Candidatus Micrarchaeota archaeon]
MLITPGGVTEIVTRAGRRGYPANFHKVAAAGAAILMVLALFAVLPLLPAPATSLAIASAVRPVTVLPREANAPLAALSWRDGESVLADVPLLLKFDARGARTAILVLEASASEGRARISVGDASGALCEGIVGAVPARFECDVSSLLAEGFLDVRISATPVDEGAQLLVDAASLQAAG